MTEADKVVDLEIRIAYQEDTLKQLSEVVYQQQQELSLLAKQYTKLEERFLEALETGLVEQGTHEKPPHY